MKQQNTTQAKVLVSSTVGLALGISAVTTGSFGAFVLPLAKEFGWERGDISLAMMLANLCNMITFPLAGFLVDRVGVRKVLLPSIILFGLALASMSLLSGSIWNLYAGYILIAACGVGTSSVTYTRLVVSWFSAKRGLALGVALAGMGLCVAFLPPLVQKITDVAGWRAAYQALGVLVVVGMLPLAWRWVWDNNEHHAASTGQATTGLPAAAGDLSFRSAIRSRAFVMLMISFALLGILTGSIPSHLVPLLVERGISAMHAATLASALGLSLIAGRLVVGYLMDRVFAPFLMVVTIAISIAGLVLMVSSSASEPWVVVAICCIGFTVGADVDCIPYLICRYIGLHAYTRIYGLIIAAFTAGISAGPALMGYSANVSGTYGLALHVLIVTTGIAIVPFLFLGRYPNETLPATPRTDARGGEERALSRPTS